MATESKTEKKSRKGGVRVVKDKVAYLLFEGELNRDSIQVLFDADKVMETMDGNPNLKRARVVIPMKRANKPAAPAAPTA